MNKSRLLGSGLFLILLASSIVVLSLPGLVYSADSESSHNTRCTGATLPATTLVSAPPTGSKGPDDITLLGVKGLAHGQALIWVAYQNGIGADGSPSGAKSTVAGYDPKTGALVKTILVTGKIDGLTADPGLNALIATVNEDDNSALNLVYPASGTVVTYAYSPNPAVSGNGGTDSIAVRGDNIYVSHSNPNDATQATDYKVTLDHSTLTAKLTPVFFDDSSAKDAVTGSTGPLAVTDPDTNFLMPRAGERFGSTLATIGQADGEIIFASHLKNDPKLWVLHLTDNVANNIPPTDGFAVATSGRGTLYVVDNGAGTVLALDTSVCHAGTIFIGEPKDNNNPLVGTLNPWTGHITPLGNHFTSPKGLLFVPTPDEGEDDQGSRSGNSPQLTS